MHRTVVSSLPALAALMFAACTDSSTVLYRQASVQVSEKSYRLGAGVQMVLERCTRESQPYPDAVSSSCIIIPLQPNQVGAGKVMNFSSSSATRAYLWQLNGPSHHLTQEVEGQVRILAIGSDSIRVALDARTSAAVAASWQWKFKGEDRYVFEPLPAPTAESSPSAEEASNK